MFVKDEPKCFCPWPYFGKNCSKSAMIENSIGFRGDGFVKLQHSNPSKITIVFSTEDQNSILLLNGLNERNSLTITGKHFKFSSS